MISFPTIFEWLERFDFLRGMPAAYLVLFATALLTVIWDWRVTIFALALQYLASSLLYVDVLDPRLAVVKLLVGLFVSLILYFTARQTNWGELPTDLTDEEAIQLRRERHAGFTHYLAPGGLPFRLLLTLLVGLVLLSLAARPGYQLPAVPPALNLAIYALAGCGLVNAGLTSEPFRSGIGLLLLLAGAELFYTTLEQSIVMLSVLAGLHLLIAVAVSYLTQLQHALPLLPD